MIEICNWKNGHGRKIATIKFQKKYETQNQVLIKT